MHASPDDPYRDAELNRLLAVIADTDHGESPFGWTDHPDPQQENHART